MKKKILLSILLILLVGGAILLLSLHQASPFRKKEVCIALIGPMKSSSGKSMLRGVRLYLDKAKKEGKLGNKKIELLILDDKNDRNVALNRAADIVDENKVLIVLGHYYSSTSIAAGDIYNKNGIPAITASATSNRVTSGNNWYFRVIPNDGLQATFIANYLSRELRMTSSCVIADEDAYGSLLSGHFESAARNLGMKIRKWTFDREDKRGLDAQLKKIVRELRAMDNPGGIFFATHGMEGIRIIKSIKYPGAKYTLIGPDSFSSPSFIEYLNESPQEQASPGYYSDGIYSVSPFMVDIANAKAQVFRQAFEEKYHEEPSWVAACYYDAMQVAVEAIEKAEIEGDRDHIRGDRRKIKLFLEGLYSPKLGIEGVSGNIYFDQNGDMNRPLSIGIYKNQKFIPAFTQYHPISQSDDRIKDTFKKALNGDIILIGEDMMTKLQVVYAGIDINEVSDLDLKHGTCTMDFYLWFRFQGEFDDANIKFTNSINPIKLDKPIQEETVEKNVTIRAYHVKADFKTDFDFYAYPFEHHIIRIKLRHGLLKRNKLILVPDILGLSDKHIEKTRFDTNGWKIEDISHYNDIISNVSSLGSPRFFKSGHSISYSQFNAAIRIERENLRSGLKNILPIIILMTLLYLTCFLPYDHFSARVPIFMAILTINAVYHVKVLSDLNVDRFLAIECGFFLTYVLVIISTLISVFIYALHRRGAENKIRFLVRTEKILHPCIVLGVGSILAYMGILA